jgi:D-glucuronyl C5-epimerase-like protein
MSPQKRRIRGAVAALLLGLAVAPAPASAADVYVVDGPRLVRQHDPWTPAAPAAPVGSRQSPVASTAARKKSKRKKDVGRRAVLRALRKARRQGRISPADHKSYLRSYNRARRTRKRLRGARRRQLRGVIATLEGIARRKRLTASRMKALFLQLRRNTRFWPRYPFPASGDRITFKGSELLFEYYPGSGLQIQPLGNFGKANGMIGSCDGTFDAPCRPERIRRLLDELSTLAAVRGRFRAWEYYFTFGGGRPPWISGMAQATGLQALARGARLLNEPRYFEVAAAGLGAFQRRHPVGVRARGPDGGVHYLQYSFNRRLFILNAFAQSVLGLYDYAQITGGEQARALFASGDRELRRETPHHDIGDWSLYSRRGAESTFEYHKLLRDFLRGLCKRLAAGVYCDTARNFTRYMREPAKLTFLGPGTATEEDVTNVRFNVSKLSTVEIKIYKGERLGLTKSGTFRRGRRYFTWRPRSPGLYTVRIAAKELRTGKGLRTRDSSEIEVEDAPGK